MEIGGPSYFGQLVPPTNHRTEATNTSLNLKREEGPASQKGLDLPTLTQRESLDTCKPRPWIATIRPLTDSASATPTPSTHLADGRYGATCEHYLRRRRIEKAIALLMCRTTKRRTASLNQQFESI